MKKNTIKTGDIYMEFYGTQTKKNNSDRKKNDIVLFSLKIKNYATSFFIEGGFFKHKEIEKKLKEYPHTNGMSGCIYFFPRTNPPAHITCGGWIVTSPLQIDEKLFQELLCRWGFTPLSPIMFMQKMKDLILYSFLSVIKEKNLSKKQILKIKWGTFSHLIPIMLTYIRGRSIKEKGCEIQEIPFSFSCKIKIQNEEFFISKGEIKFIKNAEILDSKLKVFEIAKKCRIFYYENNEKYIIYLKTKNRLYGWETFNNSHLHPRCELNDDILQKNDITYEDLLKNRLGDVLFLKRKKDLEKVNNFQKIQMLNCEFDEQNSRLIVNSPVGVVYHPEHGELTLEEGTYYVYQVPYLQKGHD